MEIARKYVGQNDSEGDDVAIVQIDRDEAGVYTVSVSGTGMGELSDALRSASDPIRLNSMMRSADDANVRMREADAGESTSSARSEIWDLLAELGRDMVRNIREGIEQGIDAAEEKGTPDEDVNEQGEVAEDFPRFEPGDRVWIHADHPFLATKGVVKFQEADGLTVVQPDNVKRAYSFRATDLTRIDEGGAIDGEEEERPPVDAVTVKQGTWMFLHEIEHSGGTSSYFAYLDGAFAIKRMDQHGGLLRPMKVMVR